MPGTAVKGGEKTPLRASLDVHMFQPHQQPASPLRTLEPKSDSQSSSQCIPKTMIRKRWRTKPTDVCTSDDRLSIVIELRSRTQRGRVGFPVCGRIGEDSRRAYVVKDYSALSLIAVVIEYERINERKRAHYDVGAKNPEIHEVICSVRW